MQKNIRQNETGSMLIEAVVAITIVGIITTIGLGSMFQDKQREIEKRTHDEMVKVVAAVREYWVVNNARPSVVADLGLPAIVLANAYGQPYQVRQAGNMMEVFTDVASSCGAYLTLRIGGTRQEVSPVVSPSWPFTYSRVVAQIAEPQAASDVAALDRKLDQAEVVPAGGIMLWGGGSCPTGFQRVSSYDGWYLAGSDGTATGGSASHNHGSVGHQHYLYDHAHRMDGYLSNASLKYTERCWNLNGCADALADHYHNVSWTWAITGGGGDGWLDSVAADTGDGSNTPSWASPLLCRKTVA